jgi:hypothetical protein
MAEVESRERSPTLPPGASLEIRAEPVVGVDPVSPEQDAEIDRRLRRYRKNPENAIPAAEVHAQVDALIDG